MVNMGGVGPFGYLYVNIASDRIACTFFVNQFSNFW